LKRFNPLKTTIIVMTAMATTKTILVIDIGNKLGWAVIRGGSVFSGSKDFAPREYDHPGRRWQRVANWFVEITSLIFKLPSDNKRIDELWFESQQGLKGPALNVYFCIKCLIEKFCYQHDIKIDSVHNATIKKHATGSGKADKDMMKAAARERGYNPTDDNEADALCLLHYVLDKKQG